MIVSLAALWYHFFTGIRHLVWDAGAGLDVAQIRAERHRGAGRGRGDDASSP